MFLSIYICPFLNDLQHTNQHLSNHAFVLLESSFIDLYISFEVLVLCGKDASVDDNRGFLFVAFEYI